MMIKMVVAAVGTGLTRLRVRDGHKTSCSVTHNEHKSKRNVHVLGELSFSCPMRIPGGMCCRRVFNNSNEALCRKSALYVGWYPTETLGWENEGVIE